MNIFTLKILSYICSSEPGERQSEANFELKFMVYIYIFEGYFITSDPLSKFHFI
jgi:hypothetical protein